MNDADREIVTRRTFDAPRELVFEAWTRPEHVAKWWGPNGFTLTTHEMDVRPGGVWRFVMHGPDGTDYQNEIKYREISPERLVYDHGPAPGFRATVTFTEAGGRTTVELRALFATAADRDHVIREFHADEGGRQHLACLAEHLAAMQAAA
jgi:uncharacterized protein YndB with AHSA1/START domain